MARNKKVEILSHSGEVLHPITDGDCVIFPDGETLTHKLSEDEAVMYTPEVVNSSPMFKVGEGDSSDYSANVLDGAYQEAVLKGQTYVNTIQEPSADVITLPTPFTEYERTQSKTFTEMQDGTFGLNLVGQSYVNCIQEPSEPSYVALGENLEFQNKKVEYTTDGQIKSAMLKGQTLVNVDSYYTKDDFKSSNIDSITSDGYISMTANGSWRNAHTKINNKPIKPNTKYLYIVEVKENTLNGVTKMVTSNPNANPGDDISVWVGEPYLTIPAGSTGIFKFIGTTLSDLSQCTNLSRNFISNVATSGAIMYRTMCIEYQEGLENIDIPYFRGMQSVTMSTELENVCSRYNSSVAKNGKTFTVTSGSDSRRLVLSDANNIAKFGFEQNTKYLVQFKVSNLNLDGLEHISIVFSDSSLASGNALFGDYNNTKITVAKNGTYRTVLTTSNVISTSAFVIKGLPAQWENTTSTSRTLTISQIMYIEYQNGMENWDLPYFETTQLMKPLRVQSVNKNVLNVPLTYKIAFQGGEEKVWVDYWGTEEYIRVQPNTTYTFSNSLDKPIYYGIVFYNRAKQVVYWQNNNIGKTFTTTSDTYYVRFSLNSPETSKPENCQLEISDTATTYTPHQSKTTSALEPITLRAIGNVKDTLDLSTGEYVQRIGEITFDGSEDWTLVVNGYQPTNTNYINFDYTNSKIKQCTYLLCDKIATRSWEIASTELNSFSIGTHSTNKLLRLCIEKTKLTTNNVTGLKAYLASNPIKVQYELAKPITRKISLEYPNLQTYQDITHVQSIAMNGTLTPNIYLPSNISYKAMLKPNTSYNVIVDREVIDSTNQLTVNLGGTTANITTNRTVVRTPSTLSNETLTFSGKDNRLAKAMLIEGSTLINGDLPHFDGIGDVKLGRVVENLCMANHTTVGGAASTGTLYSDKITSKITKTGSNVHIFQLTKNLENSKRYFIYCPYDYQYIIYGFRHEYNNSLTYTCQSYEGINKKYAIITIDGNQQKNPYTHFTVGCHGNIPVDTTMTIRRPILCEYIDGMENWDWESIGYFTGTRNIGNEFMRIGNKNLFDGINRKYFINFETFLMGLTDSDSGGVVDVSNVDNVIVSSTSIQTRFRIGCANELPSAIGKTTMLYNGINLDGNSSTKASIDCSNYKYLIINAIDLNMIQVEEASSATSYVAHKHNSLHILPNEQIPLTFVQGTIAYAHNGTWENAINNTNTTRIRTQLLDLEPNETYRVSCGHSNHGFGCQGYDNSLLAKSDSGWTYDEYYFTTTKDVHKYAINVRYKDNSNITPSALHQIRLEKVTDVHLRSVGDVKDELDLTRGVYIQRMYEVKLNGFEDWSIHNAYSTDNHLCFYWGYKKIPSYDYNKFGQWGCVINVTPLLIPRGWNSFYAAKADEEGVTFNGDNKQNITIKIRKDRLSSQDVNGFKQWLQSNPITVQYPLETPIEHKINIPMKNELNQTIAKPNGVFTLPLMYSETNHVDINSQIYPKVQSRDYISYPVIANNSQLHTVFHNKLGTGNLTVNLCGTSVTSVDGTSKCTITTPSTISQYELRLSGARNKVSNVCVFSGDYMNVNVPYVQGMMNAVNPIVKNIGKNLFDGELEVGAINSNNGSLIVTATAIRCINYIKLKQNTLYTISKSKGTKTITILFYDKDKKFTRAGWDSTFILKNNEYYIKFTDGENDLTNNYQIEESSTPSQYEPYKENIVKIYEKPLFDGEWESGSYDGNGSETNNNTVSRNKNKFIRVQPNSTIVATYYCVVHEYDENKNFIKYTYCDYTNKVTLSNRTNYINFRTLNKMTSDSSEYSNFNIQLVDEIITLRSLPNRVRDELNLQTGEYIQRIGEMTLNDNDYIIDYFLAESTNEYSLFAFVKNDIKNAINEYDKTQALCDKLPYEQIWNNKEKEGFFISNDRHRVFIRISNDKLSGQSVDALNEYLSSNPIKVQYQLETPIIKQVGIHNYPHSYKDGHVIIESNDPSTNVTAQMTYRCVTNRSGQIQEHTEQVEKQERQINELETLILENIRQNQNRSQNFLTSLISTLEIEEE